MYTLYRRINVMQTKEHVCDSILNMSAVNRFGKLPAQKVLLFPCTKREIWTNAGFSGNNICDQ